MKKLLIVMALFLLTACGRNAETDETTPFVDPSMFNQITTADLQTRLDDPNWVIVDARQSDSFNGWILQGEARGGRIAGATDFSAQWLDVTEYPHRDITQRLDDKLEVKGILPSSTLCCMTLGQGKPPALRSFWLVGALRISTYTTCWNGRQIRLCPWKATRIFT